MLNAAMLSNETFGSGLWRLSALEPARELAVDRAARNLQTVNLVIAGKHLGPPWLTMDIVDQLPQGCDKGIAWKKPLQEKLIEHKWHIDKNGQDMPAICNWKWQ
ncbi:MAG: phosphoketolase [Gammaproteobacteria bacterium]|jgi:phosphoketolase